MEKTPDRRRELTDFDIKLMDDARITREEHLASNRPCCFKCKHQAPPNNPEHAAHYVACRWIETAPIPQHMAFGNTRALMPITAGENCGAFAWRPDTLPPSA
jgi:hypothetical protein